MKWERWLLSKEEGGLGCKFLLAMNATLANWLLRYEEEKEHL